MIIMLDSGLTHGYINALGSERVNHSSQTILDSNLLRAIQVFKTSTCAPNLFVSIQDHWRSIGGVNVLLGHHLAYEDSFLVFSTPP